VLPAVSLAGDPGPGLDRVVLDVPEGPAIVEQLDGGSLTGAAGAATFGGSLQVARRVCVTPCVMDTSPGNKELRFTLVDDDDRTSTGFVTVDSKVSAYSHALGTHRNAAWKGFVGWPLLLVGSAADIGLIGMVANGRAEFNGGLVAGSVVSIGLTVLGAWLVHGSVIEDQPGNGVQWHPDPVGAR
jgi:hypothetical protein